jgi:hypothetical protein
MSTSSVSPTTPSNLHKFYWLKSRLLRTNYRPHRSLYNCVPQVFPVLFFLDCLTLGDGIDRLSRNVGI